MQGKGLKPPRKREKSEQSKIRQDFPDSFLMIEKVSFSGEGQRQNGRDTPQFHESSLRQEQIIDLQPLVLEDPNIQIRSLKEQLQKEIEEHYETKSRLKTVKQLLQNEYNVNRQQKIQINRLEKQLDMRRQQYSSLQAQLTELDNESTILSAAISQKESEIIELFAIIQTHKERVGKMAKKLEQIDPLERAKAQLEWQNGTLKKQAQSLKLMLNKQFLLQNQINSRLEHINLENDKLKTSKARAEQELNKLLKRQNENSIMIARLKQQKQQLKKETTKWRVQFATQAQRKDEQINHLHQHYNQLFKRYEQIAKKLEGYPNMIAKEVFEASIKKYEQKIQQHQEKQLKFKEQLEIIEEQIANMQFLLEEKEENEEVLLQHIKKLQKDIENYAINDNWWASILGKMAGQGLQGDPSDQKSKLMAKNQQLIQLLQKNSKTILQGEKLKLQMAGLKKQNQQLSQKQLLLIDQQKQLKQKIGSLYKQNKKLQEKLARLTKQTELLTKKSLWLQEQIAQSKLLQRDARQDYEIVSYQLYKIETAKEVKQKAQNEKNPIFLSVINENSQELLPSSHHLIKQHSIKDKIKKGAEGSVDPAIFQQLAKTIQSRACFTQQIHSYLEKIKQSAPFINVEDLKQQMKRVSAQSSKIKTILVRAGKRQYAIQWQKVISLLSKSFQSLIARN